MDLDGTFINTDMLWESLKDVTRRRPAMALLIPFWLLRGRPCLKQQLAKRANIDPAALPHHTAFRQFLRMEMRLGRKLILATASDERMARSVADASGLFCELLASDGHHNLRGATKAARLTERFGPRGFDYAGNSPVDLAVWAAARCAIVVNGSPQLVAQVRQVAKVSHIFPPEPGNLPRAPW